MTKRKVEVALRGQSFTVRSEKDEATIHALANFVSRKLDEISRHNQRRSPHELALLVALNIAEELFDAEDKSARLRRELRERSERILARIDAALEATALPASGSTSVERAALDGAGAASGLEGAGAQGAGRERGPLPAKSERADEVAVSQPAASLPRA